jgi:hypothetical protein
MSTKSKSRDELLEEMRKVIRESREVDEDKVTATAELRDCEARLRMHPKRDTQPRPAVISGLMCLVQLIKRKLRI